MQEKRPDKVRTQQIHSRITALPVPRAPRCSRAPRSYPAGTNFNDTPFMQ
jgi:hypothetical protein